MVDVKFQSQQKTISEQQSQTQQSQTQQSQTQQSQTQQSQVQQQQVENGVRSECHTSTEREDAHKPRGHVGYTRKCARKLFSQMPIFLMLITIVYMYLYLLWVQNQQTTELGDLRRRVETLETNSYIWQHSDINLDGPPYRGKRSADGAAAETAPQGSATLPPVQMATAAPPQMDHNEHASLLDNEGVLDYIDELVQRQLSELDPCECAGVSSRASDNHQQQARAVKSGEDNAQDTAGGACCNHLSKPGHNGPSYEKIEIYAGTDVTLPCDVIGYPLPDVTFAPATNRGIQVDEGLYITDAYITDSGNYTCHIENVFGSTEKVIELSVTSLPVAVYSLPSSTLEATHGSFNITCEAEGIPAPTVTLEHQLDDGSTEFVNFTSYSDNTYIYTDTDVKLSDAGNYTCVASNEYETQENSTQITIHDPVSVTSSPHNSSVDAGASFQLICDVTGTPTPDVTWQLIRIDGVRKNVSFTEITKGQYEYTQNNVSVMDAGTYVCTASNAYTPSNDTTALNVFGPPQLLSPPDVYNTILKGSTVTIRCDAIGNEPMTVTWNYPLTDDKPPLNAHVNADHSVTLTSVDQDNNGDYVCTVTGDNGVAQMKVNLRVEQPVDVTVSKNLQPINNTSTFLSFTCSAVGDPVPTTTWFKDDVNLKEANDPRYLLLSQNLIISSVQLQNDTGFYSCYGENKLSNDTDSVIVYSNLGPILCDTTFQTSGCPLGVICGATCPTNCDFISSILYGYETYSGNSPVCMAGSQMGIRTGSNQLVIWKHTGSDVLYGTQVNGIISQNRTTNANTGTIIDPADYMSTSGPTSSPEAVILGR